MGMIHRGGHSSRGSDLEITLICQSLTTGGHYRLVTAFVAALLTSPDVGAGEGGIPLENVSAHWTSSMVAATALGRRRGCHAAVPAS
ncbi:hypothetical protein PR202_ga14579 [Eleusine coracana subsp. coracana]|uniref:Uncharacterized protein n=1 Tax=Eleusine coracana subsp. coracana TaxID=191504 RepID=A0AAV5CHX2_ELECO|nr:hypothetical protein PR202_ga14579 [Eleusine coracana subsp. coracana]